MTLLVPRHPVLPPKESMKSSEKSRGCAIRSLAYWVEWVPVSFSACSFLHLRARLVLMLAHPLQVDLMPRVSLANLRAAAWVERLSPESLD
jgi:hypothetical protein